MTSYISTGKRATLKKKTYYYIMFLTSSTFCYVTTRDKITSLQIAQKLLGGKGLLTNLSFNMKLIKQIN